MRFHQLGCFLPHQPLKLMVVGVDFFMQREPASRGRRLRFQYRELETFSCAKGSELSQETCGVSLTWRPSAEKLTK